MSKQSTISYLERRKEELSQLMNTMFWGAEKDEIFSKYIQMSSVIEILKKEVEWEG